MATRDYEDKEPGYTAKLIEEVSQLYASEACSVAVNPDREEVRFVSVPRGRTLEDITDRVEALLPNPRRRMGTAILSTLESFIAHAIRFKDQHSAVFCDDLAASTPRLVSVLDYHEAGDGKPRYGQHRGQYNFPLSDEWKAWTSDNLESMSQAGFAEFIEEHIVDVVDPSLAPAGTMFQQLGLKVANPAELLSLSRGLAVRVDAKISSFQNLSTGEAQISYEEAHKGSDGGQITVPGGFVVAIPVFRADTPYRLPVRLRYRVKAGNVTWSISVQRTDLALRGAIKRACDEVVAQTELSLYYGRPE